MAYDVNVLKTRQQCLEAQASLEAELDGYQNRDQNDAFRDRQSDRSDDSAAKRLTTYTQQVTYLTGQLARTDLDARDRKRYEDQLLTATYQKARLDNRSSGAEGSAAFLGQVDADQIDAQVAVLSQAIDDVQKRHDALPA